MKNLKFIRLKDGGKAPKTSFADENLLTYDEMPDFDDVGVVIRYPYVMIDIDDDETGKMVLDIIEDEEINSLVMKTDRGYHFWFKSEVEMKSGSHELNALGIEYDLRARGVKANGESKKSYAKIKGNGVMRETIIDCELADVDELPVFLQQGSSVPIEQYLMAKLTEGGRNGTLFEYILLLQKAHISKSDIRYIITLINDYVLCEPLPSDELNVILRDESFIDMTEISADDVYDFDKKVFHHHIFANELSKLFNVKTVNGNTYVYSDGYYKIADNELNKKMIEVLPPITKKQRSETLDYVNIVTHMDNPPIDTYSVNLRNGRLNMKTGKLSEHHPMFFDTARVDVMYDPNAYDETVHHTLMKIVQGDQELFDLLCQMMGYCLVRHNNYQVTFFLYGNQASNGKSTFLDMVTELLGRENVTTLSIKDLNDPYKPAELDGKLANIGDDVSQLNIRESEIFKKVVSGEGVQVERKYKDPFTLRNTSTLIFSGNFLPSFSDKSNGITRRMVIIPFNAKFSITDPDFNPNIEQDLTTEEAQSYLIKLALKGYQQLEQNKGFVIPQASKDALHEFKNVTSTVMVWVTENEYTFDDFNGKVRDTMYQSYVQYCEITGVKNPVSSRSFVSEINEKFGLKTKQVRKDNERYIAFVEED